MGFNSGFKGLTMAVGSSVKKLSLYSNLYTASCESFRFHVVLVHLIRSSFIYRNFPYPRTRSTKWPHGVWITKRIWKVEQNITGIIWTYWNFMESQRVSQLVRKILKLLWEFHGSCRRSKQTRKSSIRIQPTVSNPIFRSTLILSSGILPHLLLPDAYFSCRMLARSQYPEGPKTGHLGTGFSWFPCV